MTVQQPHADGHSEGDPPEQQPAGAELHSATPALQRLAQEEQAATVVQAAYRSHVDRRSRDGLALRKNPGKVVHSHAARHACKMLGMHGAK